MRKAGHMSNVARLSHCLTAACAVYLPHFSVTRDASAGM